jgi:hypothetical protein
VEAFRGGGEDRGTVDRHGCDAGFTMRPSPEERSRSLLEAAESRIRQAETFAWTVPALALTAQALLFTVSFDSSVAPVGRVLASLTGLLTLLAALHFLGKHTFNFDMYEAVIERERSNLGLPRASRNHLLADVHSFPLTLALCSASG